MPLFHLTTRGVRSVRGKVPVQMWIQGGWVQTTRESDGGPLSSLGETKSGFRSRGLVETIYEVVGFHLLGKSVGGREGGSTVPSGVGRVRGGFPSRSW